MIPENLTEGIVQILRNDGIVIGTGFLVSNNLIATCAHVVQAADTGPGNKVKVRFYQNGNECNAIVIPDFWHSPDKEDLSILKLEDWLPSDVKALSLGSSAGVIGHKLCTFGFPAIGGIKGIWGHGEVLGKVTERGNPLLQIDSNEITAGFSGAPLWDESRDRVIGIIVGTIKQDLFGKLQNVAFAIPSEILQSICPELRMQDICPYRGLSSFKEEDEHLFFGREKLVQELGEQLRINPRFLAVVGSSGSGKSSLVLAGLLPRILRGEIVGFENTQIVTFRPNDVSKSDSICNSDPDESLRHALEKSGIYLEKANLWEGIRSYLEKKPEIRLVIYADQFETLFSNVDEAKQVEFLQGIQGLLKSKLKVSFLLTVRGDYYDFLLNSLLGEYLIGGQANVRSMSEEEMREAIKKPADITGIEIEARLEDAIINKLKNTKNSLPLLEFTLTKLWESRSDGMITCEAYKRIGGASGAIGQWANETYNSLNTEEKELARKIFTRLIHYGKGDLPDSRRRLPLESLAGESDEHAIHQLIKTLADAHILVTDCDLSKGTETVEIIHDSLLTEWKQLSKWISEQRGFLTWRQHLEDRKEEWKRREDEGNLLRGAPLVEAKDWMEKNKHELKPNEIKYIEASSELEEKERTEKEKIRAEKEKTRSRIIKGLAIFSLLILILAVVAFNQKDKAEKQEQLANSFSLSSKYTSTSSFLQKNPKNRDKSVLLAIESFQIRETVDADQLIRQGLLFIPHSVVVLKHDDWVNKTIFSPDGKYVATISNEKAYIWDSSTKEPIDVISHNGSVRDVNFSRDGKYVATASRDKTSHIWNIPAHKEIAVLNHNDELAKVFFSPDGKYIATMSYGSTACVWNTSTYEQIAVLKHADKVCDVELSPDGKYIATASADNTSRLWDVNEAENITLKHTLKHNGSVLDVTFSPDGEKVATASQDKTACIWAVSTGKQINVLNHSNSVSKIIFSSDGEKVATMISGNTACLWNSTGKQIAVINHADVVRDVAFCPDGEKVATASADRTSRLWDASTGKQIAVLKHDYSVKKVLFSPGGKKVATASDDETARLWDAYTGKEIAIMNHDKGILDIAFSPDGKKVATASADNTSCIWDAYTKIPVLNHKDSVLSVEFSPDGVYVATAGQDNTARVWDAYTGEETAVLKHDAGVNKAVFNRDGKYVATASQDNTARVWNTSTGENITLKHRGEVLDVAFSPDGKYVATASQDNTARVWNWNAPTGENITLKHEGWVNKIVFSPDGKYVATASADNTARIWSASTGKQTDVISHNGSVQDVEFSSDGTYVATASDDNTAKVWNWNTSTSKNITLKHTLNHINKVHDVAFSPDGKKVATASWDKTARIWNLSTDDDFTNLSHDDYVSRVEFSPDGKFIATTSYGETAFIWDASTGDKIAATSHDGVVNDVVFSPNGKYVATASDDNTAKVCLCKIEDLINETKNCLARNLTQEELKEYMDNESYHDQKTKGLKKKKVMEKILSSGPVAK